MRGVPHEKKAALPFIRSSTVFMLKQHCRMVHAWHAACMVGAATKWERNVLQNAVGKKHRIMCFSEVIRHAAGADEFEESTVLTYLMLHSTLRSRMSVTQQLLSSSHSFQVGFQGLLGRAVALLCLRPKDLDLRVEVHFHHLKDRLSLPAMSQLVIYLQQLLTHKDEILLIAPAPAYDESRSLICQSAGKCH